HPARALAREPPRNTRREGCRAQDLGSAERDERAALGLLAPSPLDRHGAQLVGGPAVNSCVGHRAGSSGLAVSGLAVSGLAVSGLAVVVTSSTVETSGPKKRRARNKKSCSLSPVASN